MAFVGLGCNLGDREATLASAVEALASHALCADVMCSSLYETEPMGPQDQPDYINAVMSVRTTLDPHDLLAELQSIEKTHGRVRDGTRWGARTLDLDLLLYGDSVIDTPTLKVPHVGIAERSFVLYPLSELQPDLIVPGHGRLSEMLSQCRQFGIRRLNSII